MDSDINIVEDFDASFICDNITELITDVSDTAFSHFMEIGNFPPSPYLGFSLQARRLLKTGANITLQRKFIGFFLKQAI